MLSLFQQITEGMLAACSADYTASHPSPQTTLSTHTTFDIKFFQSHDYVLNDGCTIT
uniref:Uncharacterized protein n=1 Tax=Arion vulgaris TaxID=1028688 RepID=A0A0B7AVJ8_9EUPU